MSDLLQAAEALLYVLGSDHSQADYATAHDALVQAVTDAGGTIAPPTAAVAPGHAPTLDEAVVAPAPAPAPASDVAHQDAVAAAQSAVAVATTTDVPPAVKLDALDAALADVDAALAQFPDSPELQDAKTQLAELKAEETGEAA